MVGVDGSSPFAPTKIQALDRDRSGAFCLANLLIDKGKTGESSRFPCIIRPDAHSPVLRRFRPYALGQCPFSVYCAVYYGQAVHSRLTQ